MSAHWVLAYLKTEAKIRRVQKALRQTLTAEIDNRQQSTLYVGGFKTLAYPPHTIQRPDSHFDTQTLYQERQATIALYPRHHDLYTLDFVQIFSPENIIMADQARDTDQVAGFGRMLRALSRELAAEIAWILFVRNPAGDVTTVQFFRAGDALDQYVHFYIDGMGRRLEQPTRDHMVDFMDGRFLFLCEPPHSHEGDFLIHFGGEDLYQTTYNPALSVYNPTESRLYAPFWIDDLRPVALFVYDWDALFDRSYARGNAPRPRITDYAPRPPACIQLDAPDEADRTLTLTGVNFPMIHHGLQFRRVDTGERSISFDMEVNWVSTQRITLDMAAIRAYLWPVPHLVLRARLMDTENGRYQPISRWSGKFIVNQPIAPHKPD